MLPNHHPQILSEHFPERCGTILVVNVPAWFNVAWKIAMPLLPEATKKKVRVARGDKDIRALFEEMAPMDQVPRRYGGTKVSERGGECGSTEGSTGGRECGRE